MSDVNWGCCPLVAQTPIVRAFIEQLAKERKAQSTIENYSRDLNDFLSAFPETPFSELLEADESCIADYVDWLWKREAQRGNGQRSDRSKITYLTGSKLAPSTRFVKACVGRSAASFRLQPPSRGFRTSASGRPS